MPSRVEAMLNLSDFEIRLTKNPPEPSRAGRRAKSRKYSPVTAMLIATAIAAATMISV
nr:hypothetical protein GCM10025699_69830 [Microbacterium flavescens]